jgi:flagellar biogenesis protein FliO
MPKGFRLKEQTTMTTDHSTECELTPDELEAVSGGMLGAIAFAVGMAWSMVALGQDTTPTNITNGINTLLNNPPAGW